MRKGGFLLAFLSITSFSFSQEIELEKIPIKKIFLDIPTQSVDYFSPERIEILPFFSLEEIIDYSSSVDLKKRSIFGIQQDISLRGSIFEDTSVSLQGIKINDPQTGHFSLELPITSADLEEIEIFKNSQRINFIPKRPKEKGFLLKSFFGQHALWEKLLSFNFPLKKVKNRFSLEHKISCGAKQDTDFEIYNFSYHSLWEEDFGEIEFLFGSTLRDFGADSFYSEKFPHQQEHTDQRFFSLQANLKEEIFKLNSTLYFRRHTDKYILDRHNLLLYTNYHTTYIYGLKNELDFYNNFFLLFDVEEKR
jgi:iron complex outermembrane receptor protein